MEHFFRLLRPGPDRQLLHVADLIACGPTLETAIDRAARHLQGHPALTHPTFVFHTATPAPVQFCPGDLIVCGPRSLTVVSPDQATYRGLGISLSTTAGGV